MEMSYDSLFIVLLLILELLILIFGKLWNMIFYKKCYEKQYFCRFKIKYGCCGLLEKKFIENVLKNILLFKDTTYYFGCLESVCRSKFVIFVNKYLNGLPLNKVWFSQAISLWTRKRFNIFVLCRHQPYKRIAKEANYFVWTSWYLGNFHKVILFCDTRNALVLRTGVLWMFMV